MARPFATAYGDPSGPSAIVSMKRCGSIPSALVRAIVSATASICVASQFFRTSLNRLPFPAGPSQSVLRRIAAIAWRSSNSPHSPPSYLQAGVSEINH
jgi:hypothetical protein